MTSEAPRSPNADSWALWISEFQPGTEYIAVQIAEAMEAHAQSMVAAAYEDATEVVAHDYVCDAIRARTPADAQAALDALLKAERVKALREAAKLARGPYVTASRYDPESPFYGSDLSPDRSELGRGTDRGREISEKAILALIEKETGHE